MQENMKNLYDSETMKNPPALGLRQTVASQALDYITKVCDMADRIAARAYERLQPVMAPSTPRGQPENIDQVEWPPLFSDIRNKMQAIEAALDSIDDALSRTEL